MRLKCLVLLGVLILISSNVFAAKKVDYYNVSDILKDPGYAAGKIAMISQLEIVEEIKAKRVYLARDQAGNKVVLNLAGKISTSPEFAKTKKIKIGTVYSIFFKISRISNDNVVQGDVQAIGFPKEVQSILAKRQQETKPEVFAEKRALEQSQVIAGNLAVKPEQTVPTEKKLEPKQVEPKSVEKVEVKPDEKPIVKPDQTVPTQKKTEPKQVEPTAMEKVEAKPKIVEVAPQIEKKVEPLRAKKTEKPEKVERGETITPQVTGKGGTNLGEIIFWLFPLILGVSAGCLIHFAKTDALALWIDRFDGWSVGKREALKNDVNKGKVKRFFIAPALWVLSLFKRGTDGISESSVKYGLKVTVYLYFIGFVIYIFIVGALLVIFGIISLIIIWIILWFMDYQSGYETYKIVRKGSKKHLIEKGAIVDTDHGELHETLTGKLKTRKIIGKDYELEDQSKIISPGTTYKVKKSDGEEGTMKKSTLLGDYEYEKKE